MDMPLRRSARDVGGDPAGIFFNNPIARKAEAELALSNRNVRAKSSNVELQTDEGEIPERAAPASSSRSNNRSSKSGSKRPGRPSNSKGSKVQYNTKAPARTKQSPQSLATRPRVAKPVPKTKAARPGINPASSKRTKGQIAPIRQTTPQGAYQGAEDPGNQLERELQQTIPQGAGESATEPERRSREPTPQGAGDAATQAQRRSRRVRMARPASPRGDEDPRETIRRRLPEPESQEKWDSWNLPDMANYLNRTFDNVGHQAAIDHDDEEDIFRLLRKLHRHMSVVVEDRIESGRTEINDAAARFRARCWATRHDPTVKSILESAMLAGSSYDWGRLAPPNSKYLERGVKHHRDGTITVHPPRSSNDIFGD